MLSILLDPAVLGSLGAIGGGIIIKLGDNILGKKEAKRNDLAIVEDEEEEVIEEYYCTEYSQRLLETKMVEGGVMDIIDMTVCDEPSCGNCLPTRNAVDSRDREEREERERVLRREREARLKAQEKKREAERRAYEKHKRELEEQQRIEAERVKREKAAEHLRIRTMKILDDPHFTNEQKDDWLARNNPAVHRQAWEDVSHGKNREDNVINFKDMHRSKKTQ